MLLEQGQGGFLYVRYSKVYFQGTSKDQCYNTVENMVHRALHCNPVATECILRQEYQTDKVYFDHYNNTSRNSLFHSFALHSFALHSFALRSFGLCSSALCSLLFCSSLFCFSLFCSSLFSSLFFALLLFALLLFACSLFALLLFIL